MAAPRISYPVITGKPATGHAAAASEVKVQAPTRLPNPEARRAELIKFIGEELVKFSGTHALYKFGWSGDAESLLRFLSGMESKRLNGKPDQVAKQFESELAELKKIINTSVESKTLTTIYKRISYWLAFIYLTPDDRQRLLASADQVIAAGVDLNPAQDIQIDPSRVYYPIFISWAIERLQKQGMLNRFTVRVLFNLGSDDELRDLMVQGVINKNITKDPKQQQICTALAAANWESKRDLKDAFVTLHQHKLFPNFLADVGVDIVAQIIAMNQQHHKATSYVKALVYLHEQGKLSSAVIKELLPFLQQSIDSLYSDNFVEGMMVLHKAGISIQQYGHLLRKWNYEAVRIANCLVALKSQGFLNPELGAYLDRNVNNPKPVHNGDEIEAYTKAILTLRHPIDPRILELLSGLRKQTPIPEHMWAGKFSLDKIIPLFMNALRAYQAHQDKKHFEGARLHDDVFKALTMAKEAYVTHNTNFGSEELTYVLNALVYLHQHDCDSADIRAVAIKKAGYGNTFAKWVVELHRKGILAKIEQGDRQQWLASDYPAAITAGWDALDGAKVLHKNYVGMVLKAGSHAEALGKGLAQLAKAQLDGEETYIKFLTDYPQHADTNAQYIVQLSAAKWTQQEVHSLLPLITAMRDRWDVRGYIPQFITAVIASHKLGMQGAPYWDILAEAPTFGDAFQEIFASFKEKGIADKYLQHVLTLAKARLSIGHRYNDKVENQWLVSMADALVVLNKEIGLARLEQGNVLDAIVKALTQFKTYIPTQTYNSDGSDSIKRLVPHMVYAFKELYAVGLLKEPYISYVANTAYASELADSMVLIHNAYMREVGFRVDQYDPAVFQEWCQYLVKNAKHAKMVVTEILLTLNKAKITVTTDKFGAELADLIKGSGQLSTRYDMDLFRFLREGLAKLEKAGLLNETSWQDFWAKTKTYWEIESITDNCVQYKKKEGWDTKHQEINYTKLSSTATAEEAKQEAATAPIPEPSAPEREYTSKELDEIAESLRWNTYMEGIKKLNDAGLLRKFSYEEHQRRAAEGYVLKAIEGTKVIYTSYGKADEQVDYSPVHARLPEAIVSTVTSASVTANSGLEVGSSSSASSGMFSNLSSTAPSASTTLDERAKWRAQKGLPVGPIVASQAAVASSTATQTAPVVLST